MTHDKRRLQLLTSAAVATLILALGLISASYAVRHFRQTLERRVAEDNRIIAENLRIIFRQVTREYAAPHEALARFQKVLEAIDTKGWVGFACILDKDGRVLAHPKADALGMQAPLSKYDPTGLLGPPPSDIRKLPESQDRDGTAVYRTEADIIVVRWLPEMMTYLCVHQSVAPVNAVARRLRDRLALIGALFLAAAAGGTWYFVGRLVDRYESSLARSEAEAREANKRLLELDQLKTDFLNTVSHELRTPLTSIRWSAESLAQILGDRPDPNLQRLLTIVRDDNQRLTTLIEQLLSFSRLDAGRLEIRMQEVDTGELLRRVTAEVSPIAARKQVQLHVTGDESPLACAGDPEQLHQVFVNLLDNAVKYTPDGGSVDVTLAREPEHIRVVVRDTGIGISAGDLPRIFDKFYRSEDAEARVQHGTGIGLAVVRGILDAHDATVTVDSEPGRGSRFTVQLPAPA